MTSRESEIEYTLQGGEICQDHAESDRKVVVREYLERVYVLEDRLCGAEASEILCRTGH